MSTPTAGVFWFVWNKHGNAPRRMHETHRSAENEAKRLAQNHRGEHFVVLQSCCEFVVDEVHRIEHEHPIPF